MAVLLKRISVLLSPEYNYSVFRELEKFLDTKRTDEEDSEWISKLISSLFTELEKEPGINETTTDELMSLLKS